MRMHKNEFNQALSPLEALSYLKEGNDRFVKNLKKNHDLLHQVNETKDGQFPFASFLSCADSRAPVELLFDQGLGDVFSVRLAGNIASDYAIASLEFSVKYLGAKIIVILGHTSCGAIKGTCDNLEDGMLHNIFDMIKPAVDMEIETLENRNSSNGLFVDNVTHLNINVQKARIIKESDTIRGLLNDKKIGIVGALYNVSNGNVFFYDSDMFLF
jgi:carbonic anhydrase